MNLIIYKHYNNNFTKDQIKEEIDNDFSNGDQTVAYISGSEDIMEVLKELIKTAYPVC